MAEGFAKNGARVIATMRDLSGKKRRGRARVRSLTGFATPIEVVEIDVLSDASVASGVARAIESGGRIDILVSNAGIVVPAPVELQPPAAFVSNIDTNLGGALKMYRAVVPHMRARRLRGEKRRLSPTTPIRPLRREAVRDLGDDHASGLLSRLGKAMAAIGPVGEAFAKRSISPDQVA